MGYLIKATIGAALFLGGIVLFNVKLLALLDIGTCASGNVPYEIAPGYECPEGTGTDILLLTASIFGGLIGAAIFAFRGDPPWGSGKRRISGLFGFGTFAWGLFFTATGATMLIAAISDDSLGADSDLGGKIVGITFLVMGLPALLIALWSLVRSFGRGDERPAAATAGGGSLDARGIMGRMRAGLDQAQAAKGIGARMQWGMAGRGGGGKSSGDALGKLERLQKLRESGAINDSEFEREKAKILAEQ
jgi:hypothetical protein